MVRRRRDQPDPGRGVPDLGNPRIDLVAWKLPALTGFGALGHLDLDIGAVAQVVAGHAEPAGRHLLDGTAARVAVRIGCEPTDRFAAFARVRPGAEPVHRDRQCLVRLSRDRAVAHGAGGEPLDDLGGRFHLGNGHRGAHAGLEFHQTSQGGHLLALIVDQPAVLLEDRILPGAGGVLKFEHGVGVEQVVLAFAAPLVLPAHLKFTVRAFVGPVEVGQRVAGGDVGGDVVEFDPAHRAVQAGEVLVEHGLGDPDGLEQLGSGVGGHRGDAHLRHHLQHALAGRLDVVLQRLLAVEVGGTAQDVTVDHVADRFESHVGVDRSRTEGDQHRHVVHLPGVAGLDNQAHLSPGALPNQMVMHRGDGEQGRDRRGGLVGLAVREDQNPRPIGDGCRCSGPDTIESAAQALPALGHRVQASDHRGAHSVLIAVHLVVGVEVDQLGQFVVTQDRVWQQDLVARLRRGMQQVALGADGGLQAGHHLFADSVQRRVGHLCEQLLKIVEQHPRPRR